MARAQTGFTLAELAVALLILALLLAGALIPLSTQIEVRNTADTLRAMEQIREAMIGFAMANGRLPCPARGDAPAAGGSTATYTLGAEQYDTTVVPARCAAVVGVVPWATLGVAEVDAWGRRFTYRVTPAFSDAITANTWQSRLTAVSVVTFPAQGTPAILSAADQSPTCPPSTGVAPYPLTPTPSLSSFALCTLGDIAVVTRNETNHARTAIGSVLPAVIVSHGRNGHGAWQATGIRFTGGPDGDGDGVPDQNADEAANATAATTCTSANCSGLAYTQVAFYSRPAVGSSSGCSDPTAGSPMCEFDDIVVMISSSMLMSRMVSAGRLP